MAEPQLVSLYMYKINALVGGFLFIFYILQLNKPQLVLLYNIGIALASTLTAFSEKML